MMGESAFEFSVNDYSWQLTVTVLMLFMMMRTMVTMATNGDNVDDIFDDKDHDGDEECVENR